MPDTNCIFSSKILLCSLAQYNKNSLLFIEKMKQKNTQRISGKKRLKNIFIQFNKVQNFPREFLESKTVKKINFFLFLLVKDNSYISHIILAYWIFL